MKQTFNLLLTILILSFQLQAQYPSKPKPMQYVSDFANMLTPAEKNNLEEKLSNFSRNNPDKIEMVLVTVTNMSGKDVKDYSIGLAENWNIGRKGKDKGILVLMAKQERKVRIEVGYGLEDKLSDTKAATIIQSVIIPEFKKGSFYNGLENGCTAIISEISNFKNEVAEDQNNNSDHIRENDDYNNRNNNYEQDKYNNNNSRNGRSGVFYIFIFLIIFFYIIYLIFRRRSSGFSGYSTTNSSRTYNNGRRVTTYSDHYVNKSTYFDTKTYSDYSDTKTYSDYSDTKYSDYSDYKDYSDYSDYSDSSSSFGGGGADGSW
jgi:uncharacterized protein